MLVQDELDTVVFLMVAPVVFDKALYSSEHLTEFSCDTLLTCFNYTCDIRVSACILVAKLVAVVDPHFTHIVEDNLHVFVTAKAIIRNVNTFRSLLYFQLADDLC